MNYLHFLSYNIFGGIGWVFMMTMLGYSLGNVPFVRAHFEKVIIAIIVISVLPAIIEMLKARRGGKATSVNG
jgi:membrane-associated protein